MSINLPPWQAKSMKVDASLVPKIKGLIKKRKEESDQEYLHGAERVEVVHLENLCFEASKKDFHFLVDEPPERAGTGKGPNPLAYFLAGAASCLMMQYAELIIAEDLKIDKLSISARARYNRKPGSRFDDVIYDVRISGEENPERIRKLSVDAESLCFASNTLRNGAAQMSSTITLNEQQIS